MLLSGTSGGDGRHPWRHPCGDWECTRRHPYTCIKQDVSSAQQQSVHTRTCTVQRTSESLPRLYLQSDLRHFTIGYSSKIGKNAKCFRMPVNLTVSLPRLAYMYGKVGQVTCPANLLSFAASLTEAPVARRAVKCSQQFTTVSDLTCTTREVH